MAVWPRTVIPREITPPANPGALKQLSHSGLLQIRNTLQVGWTWEEVYPLLSVANVDHMELFAFITETWNRGLIHTVTHPLVPGSGRAPNGLGTAGVLVDGASQVGSTILTDQWPINTPNCVRGGDVLTFAGDDAVYMVTAAAGSNASGEVTIPINPPLRQSPANNAAVTTTGVQYTVTIMAKSRFPRGRVIYYADLTVVLTEALS